MSRKNHGKPTLVLCVSRKVHTYNSVSTPYTFIGRTSINLSAYKLTKNEENLLNKGLNFIPTPSREHPSHILQDFLLFDRKLRTKIFFMDKEEEYIPKEDKTFKLGNRMDPTSNPRHVL